MPLSQITAAGCATTSEPYRSPTWRWAGPEPIDVRLGEVVVRQVRLDVAPREVAYSQALLSAAECERVSLMHSEMHRRRRVVGRARLREMLGGVLGVPPDQVEIVVAEGGKPTVRGAGRVTFSVTHTGDVALLAVANGREVGIDVEQVRHRLSWREVAARFFADQELRALDALAPSARRDAFFCCWTRKEAVLKACGAGFSRPLSDVVVPVDVHMAPTVVASRSDPQLRWWVTDLPVSRGLRAALAVVEPARA